jgi:hypothetical protein
MGSQNSLWHSKFDGLSSKLTSLELSQASLVHSTIDPLALSLHHTTALLDSKSVQLDSLASRCASLGHSLNLLQKAQQEADPTPTLHRAELSVSLSEAKMEELLIRISLFEREAGRDRARQEER